MIAVAEHKAQPDEPHVSPECMLFMAYHINYLTVK